MSAADEATFADAPSCCATDPPSVAFRPPAVAPHAPQTRARGHAPYAPAAWRRDSTRRRDRATPQPHRDRALPRPSSTTGRPSGNRFLGLENATKASPLDGCVRPRFAPQSRTRSDRRGLDHDGMPRTGARQSRSSSDASREIFVDFASKRRIQTIFGRRSSRSRASAVPEQRVAPSRRMAHTISLRSAPRPAASRRSKSSSPACRKTLRRRC